MNLCRKCEKLYTVGSIMEGFCSYKCYLNFDLFDELDHIFKQKIPKGNQSIQTSFPVYESSMNIQKNVKETYFEKRCMDNTRRSTDFDF